jgi:hypothetical protein
MNYQATTHVEEIRALRYDRERVSDLLGRYPRVSEREVEEILDYLRTARHLEIGLLTSDQRLKDGLDAFMADHKKHFQVTWAEGATVVLAIAALLIVFWLIWEAFA